MARQMKEEYGIVSEIGAGGMATVYKAVQKSLDRQVAIKELKKTYHADDQIVKRFERESRVAASLQHENIVHIYDYWKKPNYAIVMEYVDGATLADVLRKTGALPVDVGIMIAIQVSNALEYAHMRGLIHRDIKPGNIMIKRNGEVKLMDFGIAHTRSLEALTVPGMLIGTPSYMSPEQILGQQLDTRSDIFSFGIVLYEMFTGIKPFSDDDTRSVTARIIKDAFRPPRRVNGAIPRRIHRLIKKCLRKKPNRRYESMLDVERKLGRHLAGRTTKAASLHRISEYLVSRSVFEAAPEQETVIVPPKTAISGRLKGAYAATALALLAAGGAAVNYYYGPLFTNWQPFTQAPVNRPNATIVTEPTATHPGRQERLGSAATDTASSAPAPAGEQQAPKPTNEPSSTGQESKQTSSAAATATTPEQRAVAPSTPASGEKSESKKQPHSSRKRRKKASTAGQ